MLDFLKHQIATIAEQAAIALFDSITRKTQMMETQTVSGLTGQFQELSKAGQLDKMTPAQKAQLADIYAAQAERSVDAQAEAVKYGGAAVSRRINPFNKKYIEAKYHGADAEIQSATDKMLEGAKGKEVLNR